MTTLVINELLTYSFNRFDIYDAEDLRGTLSRYYGPEAITTATILLWEKYWDTLQPANDRLHRSQQSLKEKHIDDIYTAIKCINKKYPCERELQLTFVAANLANIPTSTRESDAIILNRLKILEVQMAATCTSDELLQLEGKVNRIAASQSVLGGRPVSISNGPTGAHPSTRESNAVNSEIGKYERVPVPPSGSAPIVISPKYSDVTARTNDKQHSDSFQQVLGRNRNRKRPPVVYGTNSNATLKAGPRRHEIYIFRVDSETSEDQIKDFVKGDNRSVVNIECKSLTDSWTKCYRLVVQCPDIEPLMDPSFWGNGIGVRRYFIKRNRTL